MATKRSKTTTSSPTKRSISELNAELAKLARRQAKKKEKKAAAAAAAAVAVMPAWPPSYKGRVVHSTRDPSLCICTSPMCTVGHHRLACRKLRQDGSYTCGSCPEFVK